MTRIRAYAQFMAEALPTRLMTNDQPYRSLEAFILSGIGGAAQTEIDADASIDVTGQFRDFLSRVQDMSSDDDAISALAGKLAWFGQPSSDGYLKNTNSDDGFLFQPGFSLQRAKDGGGDIQTLLSQNPDIASDILAAYESRKLLVSLLDHGVGRAPIVQTYFMSESGTLLIVGRQKPKGIMTSYEGQFSPYRYFPSRPYFWKSVHGEDNVGIFNHVTVPYIDYGGKGPVRTYCWRVQLPNRRWAMIGIDCSIPGGRTHVEKQLQRIDKSQRRLSVTIRTTTTGLQRYALRGEWTETETNWVDTLLVLANEKREASNVTGEIASKATKDGDILFAVPTGWSDADSTTSLSVAAVPKNPMATLLPVLLATIISFGLFAGGVGLLMSQYAHTRTEQEHLLRGFAAIMADSKIPFAWLNERNEFESVNVAFCQLLGFKTEDELKYKGGVVPRTFVEMVKEASAYKDLLTRSGRGEPTGPRWWTIEMRDGRWLEAKVHGEGVLIRRARSRDKLHRFGVILDSKVQSGPRAA